MLKVGYAEDNAAMPWHRRAPSKGDDFPPFERKLRARGAFSMLVAVMAVLFEGLLSVTGKGRSRTPQVFLRSEAEWTATAAPLCMWLFSLFTRASVQPACHVKGFVNSLAPVSMLCRTGSQATCTCAHVCRVSS